jgi:DNA-binding GntR family transcriptional regulator
MSQGESSHFVTQLRLDPVRRGAPEILLELRRAIVDGGVRPGSVIRVDEVADFFGVSSIPVRAALKTLIGEGLVEHRPRAGYSVAWLSVEEYTELYLVCESLELAAIPLAVQRATAEDDERLRAAHMASSSALEYGDELGYQHQIKLFHSALVMPSGMRRLLSIVETTWNMTEPGQPMVALADEQRFSLHAEHAAQLEAFEQRDVERLIALTVEHYRTLSTTIRALPGGREFFRGSWAPA